MSDETNKPRFEAKSVWDVYSFGFFQGREYEALDSLEAMRTVGEFEERQRAAVASFEAVVDRRVSAAVAAAVEAALGDIPDYEASIFAAVAKEREACAEACEAQGWSTHSGTFAAAVRARAKP